MDNAIRYWTGCRMLYTNDYLYSGGACYIRIGSAYYPADPLRIMRFVCTLPSGEPLYEGDHLVANMENGKSYSGLVGYSDTYAAYVYATEEKDLLLSGVLHKAALLQINGNYYTALATLSPTDTEIVSTQSKTQLYKVYTSGIRYGYMDGEKVGAWAYIIDTGNDTRYMAGRTVDLTSNQAELLAAINAVSAVPPKSIITLYTDATYITDAFSKGWIKEWKQMGWLKKSNHKPVLNAEYWQQLYDLCKQRDVTMVWVRDDAHLQHCDRLAEAAAREKSSVA